MLLEIANTAAVVRRRVVWVFPGRRVLRVRWAPPLILRPGLGADRHQRHHSREFVEPGAERNTTDFPRHLLAGKQRLVAERCEAHRITSRPCPLRTPP